MGAFFLFQRKQLPSDPALNNMSESSCHKNRPSCHIGCSGWYYASWRGVFYPPELSPSLWLDFYSDHFDTVEINSSFYRLPSETAVAHWGRSTPDRFVFSPKASRHLTHMAKLQDSGTGLVSFLEHFSPLEKKLGPILFQLPPYWKQNAERLEFFLKSLPSGYRYAFEMRNPGWHNDRIYALLEAYGAAFCIFDLAGFRSPVVLTAEFAYIRLHGPGPVPYTGSYSTGCLQDLAERILDWQSTRAIYVYFNNDRDACSIQNAMALKKMLSLRFP